MGRRRSLVRRLDEIRRVIHELYTEYLDLLRELDENYILLGIEGNGYTIDRRSVMEFFKNPFFIQIVNERYPQAIIAVPKFIEGEFGVKVGESQNYAIYVLNPIVRAIIKDLPKPLEDVVPLLTGEEHGVYVSEDRLNAPPDLLEELMIRYPQGIIKKIGRNVALIRRDHRFPLIATLVRMGYIPFKRSSVSEDDLRTPILKKDLRLRDYQEEALNMFLQYGAIGIYWPFGTGKSLFALYLLSIVRGKKLVIVPTRTLKSQWIERIEEYLEDDIWDEVEIHTYRAYSKVKRRKWKLVIFDEVHHLPADTYSKLSMLKTKYRVGLTGTPYREDGRADLIIALTGVPHGMNHREFIDKGIISPPKVIVERVDSEDEKPSMVKEIVMDRHRNERIIVFCDYIEMGRRIAEEIKTIFIYGRTEDRLEKIRGRRIAVVSRVGDEGMSLPNIDVIVEACFHYGSRRQQLQRVGRLYHSNREVKLHYILMTDEEVRRYYKRLFTLGASGIEVEYRGFRGIPFIAT